MIPADSDSKKELLKTYHTKSVVPLDDALGLSRLPFKMSLGLMLEVAFWAQNQSSYQAAEDVLQKVYGLKINDDTVRLVTNVIGKIVFDADCKRAEEAMALYETCKLDFKKHLKGTLYIELDGAALNTRVVNDDGSSWRENKLGMVFSSNNIRYYKNARRKDKREHKILKREYVSYLGGVESFKKHLFSCALRNGYGQYEKTVILSDGAKWIANLAAEQYPDAQHILDYFHLCENVNTYAKCLFGEDSEKWEPWADRICEMLKEGRSDEVLSELDPKKTFPNCVNLSHYIKLHKNHIDYPKYLAEGWFIGSGAIESGNKVVLQKRLKQAGMRWDGETAQYLLALRAKQESELWNEVVETVTAFYGTPGTP